jgi:transposase
MFDKDFLTTKEVYLHIKNEFNVDYSLKQVREIIRKLKYTWIKPYPIATKSPNNAKELLKERTKEINPDKDIYGTFR